MGKSTKKAKKKSFGDVVVWIIVAIVVVLGIGLASRNIAGATEKGSIAIVLDDEYVFNNAGGVVLDDGDEIEIQRFDGIDGEMVYTVHALTSSKRALSFTWNGTSYEWNEAIAGQNLTKYFSFEADDLYADVMTLTYRSGDQTDVLDALAPGLTNYTCGEKGDLFRLTVAVGGSSVSLDFSAVVHIDDVGLSDASIIF